MKHLQYFAHVINVRTDGGCNKKISLHTKMYIPLFLSQETSKILQSTEIIHEYAIDFTVKTTNFVIEHNIPYPIKYATIHSLQEIATFGDHFGSFVLSIYFSLIYFIIENM